MNPRHLTHEEFTELLGGEGSNNAAILHVEECSVCRSELESLQNTLADVRELSLRWAERRARKILVPSRWMMGWQRLPSLSAVASLLLCGMAIGIHYQGSVRPVADVSQVQSVAAPPSDDELNQDNRLLRSIDQELNQQVVPQVPSELTASSRALHRSGLREVAN